ncbi:Coenzyme F420 hydrogenase/dehydrogenase, beta subunit C-terminal domain [Phaeovibrio sulfidiphilus]|uniref:Coenzyme F420 hydrogenase/dehydrogenase, beta subunit C-terminal domain n=1 Tax=Phaeovibrio sulfidiphilus TaxID=1220600 RepID=A0A8J6YVF4_9PROT|nr:Coenzyme F420 hydrogenase/dehydrogenase, beta subunit C-terminal domain [Phaeovibrio sulfidiphilus]MBE1237124.1 Coenzyme F420 hydrogenase/dehydrogenase, beta subunit C-terminal domain [Phaeovibrio sulfidiphilus]
MTVPGATPATASTATSPTAPCASPAAAATAAPQRTLCTDCGVSRLPDSRACGVACQFIRPDYEALERSVHGRTRNPDANPDELFFGVFQAMHRAALTSPRPGAQWTGITTRIAERLLETGTVEAVVAIAPDADDIWKPRAALVTAAADMAACRGMRMGYAPLVEQLAEAKARGLKRVAFIGVPCQVHPVRALEDHFGFEKLYVIGIPCSDNTTTENFHTFLGLLTDRPETVTYLEFYPDYHVEMRFQGGKKKRIPFLMLPLSTLPTDFFPLTCRACVDYPNTLADITVGYMGGEGEQWLVVRNARGQELLDLLGDEVRLSRPGDKGKRATAVKGFLDNVERAAGGLPLRRMPSFLRPIVAWLMPKTGPRGLEFARTRVEMKALEAIVNLRRFQPARVKSMVPAHVWKQAEPYGLVPRPGERPGERPAGRAGERHAGEPHPAERAAGRTAGQDQPPLS